MNIYLSFNPSDELREFLSVLLDDGSEWADEQARDLAAASLDAECGP